MFDPAFPYPIRGIDSDNSTGSSSGSNSSNGTAGSAPELSPSVVVIIVLITVVFFLSGFLHLLARCFARPNSSSNNNLSRRNNSSGSLNSLQLQHLFHLHDSGVEQAFIDALPVFLYRAVRGLKEGADCAVCLNEFSGEDRLRLLPKCSHAFHIECIDTWLLSHSTCPLCRCSLVPDHHAGSSSASAALGGGGMRVESFGASSVATTIDSSIASERPVELVQQLEEQDSRLVPVKLGRFCPNPAAGQVPAEDQDQDQSAVLSSRRSYSMGSYEYVLDSSSVAGEQLAVVLLSPTPLHKKWVPRGTPGHRAALSECIPGKEYASGGSPWVTIDIDPRPMLQTSNVNPPRASLLSWAPWRKSSAAASGGSKGTSTAGSVGEKSFNSDKIKSFSFRLNGNNAAQHHQEQFGGEEPLGGGAAAVWWWKNRGSSRRCLSESNEQQFSTASAAAAAASTDRFWDQASVCSTNAEMKSTGSAASSMTTVSIARRTLQWLMGRDKHHHRSSTDDQAAAAAGGEY